MSGATGGGGGTGQPSAGELIEIRHALEDLNAAFARHLDHGNVDALAALFTDDALYTHGTRRSEGRDAIRRLFEQRLAAGPRTSRHLISGLRLAVESRTRASGTSVCATFAGPGRPPLVPAVPILVADFDDVYVRGDDGCWRFASRHIERIFEDPAAGGPVGRRASGGAAADGGDDAPPGSGPAGSGAAEDAAGGGRRTEPGADVDLSLEPPSTYIFTGEICTQAYRLNRFAFDFKDPDVRRRFAEAPEALMSEYGLSDTEKALLRERDWTGLVAHGGHHFNIIKIAAAVGESHMHVGAHMRGTDWAELRETLPRRVDLMPGDLG